MDVIPPDAQHAEGGAGVVVTLAEMYQVLLKIDATTRDLKASTDRLIADITKHEARLNAHDVTLRDHHGRLGALETWIDTEQRGEAPRANAATVASVIVAGLSVAVAVIAIIVGSLK